MRTSDGVVTSNQTEVRELLANYFTTAASNISGDHVNNLISENDHQFHNSVQTIREMAQSLNLRNSRKVTSQACLSL